MCIQKQKDKHFTVYRTETDGNLKATPDSVEPLSLGKKLESANVPGDRGGGARATPGSLGEEAEVSITHGKYYNSKL